MSDDVEFTVLLEDNISKSLAKAQQDIAYFTYRENIEWSKIIDHQTGNFPAPVYNRSANCP